MRKRETLLLMFTVAVATDAEGGTLHSLQCGLYFPGKHDGGCDEFTDRFHE